MIKDYVGKDRRYRLRPWVRCVASALAAVLIATGIGVIPKAPQKVEATEETAQVKNVNLGTLGITDPVIPESVEDAWSGSYVYFGKYNDAPIKFRVLDSSTQEFNGDGSTDKYTMLLDCDNILFDSTIMYSTSEDDIYMEWQWQDCYLKALLNSEKISGHNFTNTGFLTTAFSNMEQDAIAQSVKDRIAQDDYNYPQFYYTALTGEKVFVLDGIDVRRKSYGYMETTADIASRKKMAIGGNYKGYYGYWLLRTCQQPSMMVNIVNSKGGPAGWMSTVGYRGISPALNIDISSVAFVTESNMDKADSFAVTNATSGSGEWRLTLIDSAGINAYDKSAMMVNNSTYIAGESVTVSVTNVPLMSNGESYSQISAMLVDEAGTVVAYGKVADGVTVGDIEVTIPAGVETGQYTLRVFAEKVNSSASENLTDYVSDYVGIPITVSDGIGSVAVDNLAQPIAGVVLDTSATCDNDNVVSTTLIWKNDNETVTGTADYHKVYTACVTLVATEGMSFGDRVTATVNGNPATYTKLNADGSLEVGYTFDATEKKGAVLEVIAPVFEEVYVQHDIIEKPIIITNAGDEDVVIKGVTIDESSGLILVGDNGEVTITPGQSIDKWSLKTDRILEGVYKTTVTVEYNDGKVATAETQLVIKRKAISTIEVIGVVPPKGGQFLAMSSKCYSEGVATNEPWTYWRNVTEGRNIVSDFVCAKYNTQYEVVAEVYIDAASYFITSDTKVTVNGNPATSVKDDGLGKITVTYLFDATDKESMETPDITINYREEVLEGFVTDGSYTINGVSVAVTDGRVSIQESWFGTTVSIVCKGDDTHSDSAIKKLCISQRPDAPKVIGVDETVYGNNDGKIMDTTADMEYRKALPVLWNDCAGKEVTNLSPGYYEVRLKATDTSFAGKTAKVEIKTGVQACDVSVVNGTGAGTYPVGDVITVVADAAPAGKKFKCWSVVYGLAQLGDTRDSATTLVVPQGAVEIQAEYEDVIVVEPPTEAPTEVSTEETTEETTEATIEHSTEAATEESTEATTEVATEEYTEILTEEVGETETDNSETIEMPTEDGDSPSTGDRIYFIWIIVALILSLIVMALSLYDKKYV